MLQLWTISKIGKIPASLRSKIKFYAPLIDSLDFYGIDPVTFTRPSVVTRNGRDGLTHDVAENVPRFYYYGDPIQPWGLGISLGETWQYAAANNLDSANTLIWFEDLQPKSTPTNTNPFDSNGIWTGNLDVHVKHILGANAVLSNSEIIQLQTILEDVAQTIPEPPEPPIGNIGSFMSEVPSGTRNGSNVTFTLSQDCDPNSLILTCFGGVVELVASSPGELEFTLSGAGNRTITMGLAPQTGYPFKANYVIAT